MIQLAHQVFVRNVSLLEAVAQKITGDLKKNLLILSLSLIVLGCKNSGEGSNNTQSATDSSLKDVVQDSGKGLGDTEKPRQYLASRLEEVHKINTAFEGVSSYFINPGQPECVPGNIRVENGGFQGAQ